ncbi:MAG: RNA methyltransferase [Pseudomonadota bacterium]
MIDLSSIRIVLVEPSHPGNIGGAARAMKTMGLGKLVVVNPRRYPDPQADWRAAGALDVLDAAEVVADVDSAIAQCHWVVGTSTRNRRIPWPVADAKRMAGELAGNLAATQDQQVAILFGREDNGLSNEELQRCHLHLQIPAAPEYSSLNLAMAVQVVCYELFQAMVETEAPISAPGDREWDRPRATAAQVEGMLQHMEDVLIANDFLQADNPGQTMTRLRRLFARTQLDDTEVQIMRGIFKHFGKSVP